MLDGCACKINVRSLHANVAAVACTAAAVSVYVADDRELAVHRIDLSSIKRDGAAVSIDCTKIHGFAVDACISTGVDICRAAVARFARTV